MFGNCFAFKFHPNDIVSVDVFLFHESMVSYSAFASSVQSPSPPAV